MALKPWSYIALWLRFKDEAQSLVWWPKMQCMQVILTEILGTFPQCDCCHDLRQLTNQQKRSRWCFILARWHWFTFVIGCNLVCISVVQFASCKLPVGSNFIRSISCSIACCELITLLKKKNNWVTKARQNKLCTKACMTTLDSVPYTNIKLCCILWASVVFMPCCVQNY